MRPAAATHQRTQTDTPRPARSTSTPTPPQIMLSAEEVAAIWESAKKKSKDWFKGGRFEVQYSKPKGAEYPEVVWPEFWPGFNVAAQERERLRAHIEPGHFPERLYRFRAPNSTDRELAYIRANHKQITLPVYEDTENTIQRALSDGNWSIDYKDAADETMADFKEYVTTDIEEYGSLTAYVRYVLPRLKMLDPMGVIVNLPHELSTVQTEAGEVINPDDLLEPQPKYYPCTDVWGYEGDEWYLIKSHEQSPVEYGGRIVDEGLVMLLIDDTNVWRITQTGRRVDAQFNISLWFAHDVGEPPVIHLMGKPRVDGGRMLWQSPFLVASDSLDIALLDNSYLQLSKATGVFPYRIMLGDVCDFERDGVRCHSGFLDFMDESGAIRREACPACKETPGLKSRLSPAGVMLVKPPDSLRDGEVTSIPNAIQWVAPPTETLEFLRSEINANLLHARQMLHLSGEGLSMSGDSKEVKTATQSGIDQRAMYAFVGPISDQLFQILAFLLKTTGIMRYGQDFQGVELRKPNAFDIRTEADLVAELQNAQGLPPAVIDNILWGYINQRFITNPSALRMFQVIAQADALFALSEAQIAQLKASNAVEPWKLALHYQAVNMYEQLLRESKVGGGADLSAEVQQLQQMAREAAPTSVPGAVEKLMQRIQ